MSNTEKPIKIDHNVIDNATDEQIEAFVSQYSRGDEEAIKAIKLYDEAAKRGDASAIKLMRRFNEIAKKQNSIFVKSLEEGDIDAMKCVDKIKHSYIDGILSPGEIHFILNYANPAEGDIDKFINAIIGDPAEAEAFLEGLTPGKVKTLLPGHEVTPQEKKALTYSREEWAILRTGNKKEIAKVKAARRERAKHFLASLNVLDFITITRKGISSKRYNTFKPTPASETATKSEDYTTISTTQFYRVTSEVINIADLEKTAKNINRRKKKEIAENLETKELEAIQVNERGGGLTLAKPKSLQLEKIAENGQKEFDYVIGQIYKRVYDTEHNQIKPGAITITDNDLVKYKVCGTDNKTVNRRNFLNFLTFLSECKAATVTYGKKKKGEPETTIDKMDVAPLFKRITTKRGGVYELIPNEEFNWGSALQYYTNLPLIAFTLSGRAYQALNAILQKARMTAADRQNPAEINISLMEIADLLRLPLDTSETRKLIKTPIRNIIDEINEIVPEISLTLDADDNANKTDYLTGSIKATFSGELLQNYKTIKEQKGKNIKKQIEKHNRAIKAAEKRKNTKKE